jgi:hypothetical protein
MSTERLVWQGQKQEKQQAARRLELGIGSLRNELRSILNPHMPVYEIDQERLAALAFELADKVIRFRQVRAEIAAIKQSLGES